MTTKRKIILCKKLQEERRELNGKIIRLRLFLDNPHSDDEFDEYAGTSSADMRWVMEEQFRGMMQYRSALSERIEFLKNGYEEFEGDN